MKIFLKYNGIIKDFYLSFKGGVKHGNIIRIHNEQSNSGGILQVSTVRHCMFCSKISRLLALARALFLFHLRISICRFRAL